MRPLCPFFLPPFDLEKHQQHARAQLQRTRPRPPRRHVGPTADRAQSSACRFDTFLLATASGRPRAHQARAHGCRREGVSPDDHATRFRDVAVEDLSEIHLVKIGRLCLSRSAGLAEQGGGRQDPESPTQPQQLGRRLCPSSRVEAEPAHELVSRRDARRLVVLPCGLAERTGLPVGWSHFRVVSVQQLR